MTSESSEIEFNEHFTKCLNLMESNEQNVFITGKAGTGKSTLLNYFREKTSKQIAILAPTGTAAVNVKGQTIHSFFGFKPDVTESSIKRVRRKLDKNSENIYQKLDAIIIDEISMVRADLLDCIDKFLRINGKDFSQPFGGVQTIFIGDLYQLPPIVPNKERESFNSLYKSPYFFSSKCFDTLEMEYVELEKIYRQKDNKFIKILNSIRNNSISDKDIEIINQRCNPTFEPSSDEFYIYLTTKNARADVINTEKLEKIQSKEFISEGITEDDFPNNQLPNAQVLKLKVGAQVMMLTNDTSKRYFNGSIGKINKIDKEDFKDIRIEILLDTGKCVWLKKHVWESFSLSLENGGLKSEVTGTYTQYPIMLAWAITVHKSQGKTFEKAIFDVGSGTFAHGQMYVALSRCRNLDGLVLKAPIAKRHIWMDWNVVKFVTEYQYKRSDQQFSLDKKIEFIKNSIVSKSELSITYLQANDEKSYRSIIPKSVGEMIFKDKKYIGLSAFCLARNANRVFRVDRILEIFLNPLGLKNDIEKTKSTIKQNV